MLLVTSQEQCSQWLCVITAAQPTEVSEVQSAMTSFVPIIRSVSEIMINITGARVCFSKEVTVCIHDRIKFYHNIDCWLTACRIFSASTDILDCYRTMHLLPWCVLMTAANRSAAEALILKWFTWSTARTDLPTSQFHHTDSKCVHNIPPCRFTGYQLRWQCNIMCF
jgi:hypothetical protein